MSQIPHPSIKSNAIPPTSETNTPQLTSTTHESSTLPSSKSHPPRFPYDLFAYVGRTLDHVYADYPDTPQFIFNDVAGNAGHQLLWVRVPSDGEAEREKIREFEREELKAGRWKRPYAHLVAAGRDINSASGKPQKWIGPEIVLNFDTPSRVVCYRVVIISELTSPDFNEPKDWEVHSVVGFPEMPPDDFMRQTRHDYLRALG